MVQIQNSDAITAVRDGAKLSISEGFPTNLLPNVQAVLDMTPRFHRNATSASGFSIIQGAVTVLTASTDTNKRTFLTGATLAYSKDAACDFATGYITLICTQGATTKTLLNLPVITLTAQQDSISIVFNRPIEIDAGTTVRFGTVAYAAGLMARSAIVYYYETT